MGKTANNGKVVTPFFEETGFKSVITEFAFALAAYKGEEYLPSGTAVIIGNNLAITAKHVIDDYQKKFDGKVNLSSKNTSFAMLAVQGVNEGKSGALWKVAKIWRAEKTDIAFLLIEPFSQEAEQYKWRRPVIDLSPPEVGSKIFAFGYHNSQMSINRKKEVRWELHPTTSAGEIKNIYWEKRDRALLNFPCVQTDVKFGSSMSGGPVFNEKGHLCGLICADLEDGTNNAHSVSYYSMLWPSLVTKLDVNRQGYPPDTDYFILDLMHVGIIKAVGYERVKIAAQGNSTGITYDYSTS